jgi:hypothetical protein
MPTSRFDKFLAVSGVLAAVVFVVAAFHGDPPGVSASAHERVQWYLDHKSISAIGGFGTAYFAVLFTFFTTGVRKVLRSGEPGESTYSTAALAGGVLVATGSIFTSVMGLATLEAADKHQDAVVTTLSFVAEFSWLPVIAGLAVFYLATGLGGLRTATLPKWLSIVTIVLGVACVLGPTGIGAWFATPLWLIVVSVLMLRRIGSEPTPLAAGTSTPSYAGRA